MSVSVGQHLKLRCFLEGIEVPIISASLAVQANAPAQCQVQIPATDKSLELLPRTLVHVFFRDYYDGPGDHVTYRTDVEQVQTRDEAVASAEQERQEAARRSDEVAAETTGQDPEITDSGAAVRRVSFEEDDVITASVDPEDQSIPADTGDGNSAPVHASENEDDAEGSSDEKDRRWKLFFVGEVTGFQFQKTPRNRSIILSCLDPSVYWDTCYQYKVNTASLTGNGMANFVGAGTQLFDEFFQSSTSILVSILNRNSRSRPELTGLLSGVVHLLERVGGVYRNRGFRGVNDFFSLAELRLHLVDMITASERDETSRRMAPRMAYNRFMRRQGGNLGKIASFREMLTMINRFIFHDVFPCPLAMYIPDQTRTEVRSGVTSEQQARINFRDRFYSVANSMEQTKSRIETQISDERYGRAQRSLRQYQQQARTLGRMIQQANARTEGDANLAATLAESARRFIAGQTPNPSRALRQLESAHVEARRAFHTAEGFQISGGRWRRTVTTGEHERLNAQILRPDVWMASPPRCNVIFPELYNNISYSRQYMQEVSRMRLTVTDEIFGSDSLLNQWYYAPDVEVLGERAAQVRGDPTRGATLRQNAYGRRLMNHELYTGVVPVFERMNEVNVYSARTDPVAERGARVPYIVRAAHFQFFKHRFTPRTIAVEGKFNPYAVPGFPAVVIDKYMTTDQLEASNLRGLELLEHRSARDELDESEQQNLAELQSERQALLDAGVSEEDIGALSTPEDVWLALRRSAPTQLVGMIVGLNHTVTQVSATTSYQLQYGRTHREHDELLGANRQTIGRREAGTATRTTVVAAPSGDPPRGGQMGPYFGTIVNVTRVDRTGEFLLFGTFLPNNVRRRGRRARNEVRVPVGVRQPISEYPAEATRIVGTTRAADGSELEVEFSAYEIEEEVERIRGEEVDVPFEDFVRPPWFSDVWKNDRIGATYQQFFGTGAVTDDLMVYTGNSDEAGISPASADLEPGVDHADAQVQRRRDPTDWQLEDGGTVQESEMRVNVERAVDLLVRSYSSVKHEELDVQEFIRAYTWRPIANIIDILGSRDLVINQETGVTEEGSKGLHSLAFGHGPMGRNIRNLMPDENARRILGIGVGEGQDRANLLERLDKRADKAEKVQNYVRDLWADRGQLG